MQQIRIKLSIALAAALGVCAPAVAGAAATNAHLQGWIVSVNGDVLMLRLRDGKKQKVDLSAARTAHHTGALPVGGAIIVYGTRDASGTFHVVSVGHSSPDPKQWAADD